MSLVCLAKQEYRYDWNWNRAERHFRQALEADPSDADVFTEFSIMLSIMRRFDESLSCIRQACLLDPISPAARLQAGHAHYAAGQWEAAVAEYQRVLRCTPGHVCARWGLADALTRLGQPRQAIAILMEGVCMAGTDGNPLLLTSLSRTNTVLEARAASPLRLLEAPQQTRDPVILAELYGFVGKSAKTFSLLNEAADIRHYRLDAFNMFPQFKRLREDQRCERLLKRIGLCR